MSISTDKQFGDSTIKGITPQVHGTGFTLDTSDGCIFEANPKGLPLPEAGQTVRMYGRGMGYIVRGIVVGEHVYRYRTEAENEAQRLADIKEADEAKRQKFEDNLPQWNADLLALPEAFRDRILRFTAKKKDWDWDLGPYEMFVCKEAHKIIKALSGNTSEDVSELLADFCKAPRDEQRELLPDMAFDEHSDNTFGAACMLARVYFLDESMIPQAHGAACPLVGCKEYGCFAADGA